MYSKSCARCILQMGLVCLRCKESSFAIPSVAKFIFFVYAGNASRSSFGPGRGPIFLEYMDCSGFEESLLDCDHNGLGLSTCEHYEDAGVVCQGEMLFEMKQQLVVK